MFEKHYIVKKEHIDFQGVVDGLYYPFYMEWCRHDFMKEVVNIDIEKAFNAGESYMILEYTIKFKKSIKKDDKIKVTCEVKESEKKNRIIYFQKILIDDICFSEASFLVTCLINGRPSIPESLKKMAKNS